MGHKSTENAKERKIKILNPGKILELAKKNGYETVDWDETNSTLLFKKEKTLISVYYKKESVVTIITHPIKGRSKLVRKNVTINDLNKIFLNPRVHTGKGNGSEKMVMLNYKNKKYSGRKLARLLEKEHAKYRKLLFDEFFKKREVNIKFQYAFHKNSNFEIERIDMFLKKDLFFCVYLKDEFCITTVDPQIFILKTMTDYDKMQEKLKEKKNDTAK